MDSILASPMALFLASLIIGMIAALCGGALSGYAIGGRDLGAEVATQVGGLFGAMSGLPGVAIALLIIAILN
jgi:hypothetical protein